MSLRLLAALSVAALTAILCHGSAGAHEGHDHGEAPPPATAQASPRGEASSDLFELVAIFRNGSLDLYLDRFDTNEPVDGAIIEVEAPGGPLTASARAGDPYRIAAPWLEAGQRHDILFTVTAGEDVDVLPLALEIPAPKAAEAAPPWFWAIARARAGTSAQLTAESGLLVAGALGFILGIGATALVLGRRRRSASALALALVLIAMPAWGHDGHDHGNDDAKIAIAPGEYAQRLPDGSVFVPKPVQRIFGVRTVKTAEARHPNAIELTGRIIPDPDASGFVQTAIGGRLSPPPEGFSRLGARVRQGQILAYVMPPLQAIDVSDIRQRQGELDQQILIVRQRLARYEELAPRGAVPRAQLDEARIELAGLTERRQAIEQARREPEALVAPVAGVIAEGTPVAGQMAQPNAVVYHIVEPKRLWVEALSFVALDAIVAASGLVPGAGSLALSYRGTGLADRSQSVPVHFAIEDAPAGLRAGQFVTVTVLLPDGTRGIAVPKSSIVRNANGQDFVYEHVTAERFQPRQVRIAPLDATRVLIAAGVEPGKRIVSQGAELLGHVR